MSTEPKGEGSREPTLTRAGIIAVGSELLTPFRTDTNSLFITGKLNDLGIEVTLKAIVGDDLQAIVSTFEHVRAHADLMVLTGGLGPTADDLTREAVALALGLSLDEDTEVVERIRRRFARRGLEMPEVNRRQALVPRGAIALENANGTAPGLWIEPAGGPVLLLPGPPREMQPMLDRVVETHLARYAGPSRLYRRVMRIAGRTESHVEEAVQPVYSRWAAASPPIATTILASPGQIELHLTVHAAAREEAESLLDRATSEIATVLGPDLFSADERLLEEVVGGLLRQRRFRIALAESCTGGLVASRLTDVPGSSDYVDASLVTYSNAAKTRFLGVPESLIRANGAVSAPVALGMATGVRERTGADVGVGITGIAGPGGGTPEKPVGLVVIAVAGPGDAISVRTFTFPGERRLVKFQASQAALDAVRRVLLDSAEPVLR
jgi:nicotinamide-nucleotide amidase